MDGSWCCHGDQHAWEVFTQLGRCSAELLGGPRSTGTGHLGGRRGLGTQTCTLLFCGPPIFPDPLVSGSFSEAVSLPCMRSGVSVGSDDRATRL